MAGCLQLLELLQMYWVLDPLANVCVLMNILWQAVCIVIQMIYLSSFLQFYTTHLANMLLLTGL